MVEVGSLIKIELVTLPPPMPVILEFASAVKVAASISTSMINASPELTRTWKETPGGLSKFDGFIKKT